MKITFDSSGLDKIKRNLKKFKGQNDIPLTELMTDEFIRENTDFQSYR